MQLYLSYLVIYFPPKLDWVGVVKKQAYLYIQKLCGNCNYKKNELQNKQKKKAQVVACNTHSIPIILEIPIFCSRTNSLNRYCLGNLLVTLVQLKHTHSNPREKQGYGLIFFIHIAVFSSCCN